MVSLIVYYDLLMTWQAWNDSRAVLCEWVSEQAATEEVHRSAIAVIKWRDLLKEIDWANFITLKEAHLDNHLSHAYIVLNRATAIKRTLSYKKKSLWFLWPRKIKLHLGFFSKCWDYFFSFIFLNNLLLTCILFSRNLFIFSWRNNLKCWSSPKIYFIQ